MSDPEAKKEGLKKELGLFSVFALATGTTLSGGFFLLPGVALAEYQAGPAIILAYLLAALPLIPAMLCLVELSTAMPKAGGGYYFLDRAMGPLIGTIGGLGTWIALMLKTAFALIGMGAYLALLSAELQQHVMLLAVGLALLFGCLNLAGAKKASAMQGYLVVGLLAILAIFLTGLTEVPTTKVFNKDFLGSGWDSILATSGMVFVSYVGISKVASLAEEVKNPDRNLPLGVGLSLVVCISIYAVGTYLMVGVLGTDAMAQSQTVVADAAAEFLGPKGRVLMVVAAVLAFASVANSGILSASRYPLAMARDHLVSPKFRQLSASKIPRFAIVVTMALIVLVICTMPVGKIAKLASAFQLLMFALVCLAVIVMRESRIDSYDPGYRAPFYPYLQIFGVISACWFIGELGWAPLAFSLMLLLAGGWWYRYYAMNKVRRDGAIYHIFERLGQRRYEGLDVELRGIMKERGLREGDPFDDIIARARVINLEEATDFDAVTRRAAGELDPLVPAGLQELIDGFTRGTRVGATPVAHGVALPHLRLSDMEHPELVLVRIREKLRIEIIDPTDEDAEPHDHWVQAVFFLISPRDNPGQHLRVLAQMAGKVDDDTFMGEWLAAGTDQELKETLLRNERYLSIRVAPKGPSAALIGRPLYELGFPEGCLIALIHRGDTTFVPGGHTSLAEADRLTIIGDPDGIKTLRETYGTL